MLALVVLLMNAPVPFTKPPPPPPGIEPGAYVMVFHTIDCSTSFHKDGFYACDWNGTVYEGHWRQDKGVLVVEEWPIRYPDRRTKWNVYLKCSVKGMLNGTTPWRLKPEYGWKVR